MFVRQISRFFSVLSKSEQLLPLSLARRARAISFTVIPEIILSQMNFDSNAQNVHDPE